MDNKVYVIMYHYVRDLEHSRYPRIKGLDIACFRKQIEYLKQNFTVITMEELNSAFNNQYELPKQAVLLTFDDGYLDHYTSVFPILKAEHLQGSFFISGKTLKEHVLLDVNKIHYILATTQIDVLLPSVLKRMDYYRGSEYEYPDNDTLFHEYASGNRFDSEETIFAKRMLQTVLPEKVRSKICDDLFKKYVGISEDKLAGELYLTSDQIRLMKQEGMYIGLHGYNHYWLGHLPEEEMQKDIRQALDVMSEYIDDKNWVMNYPYGSYNEALLQYISSTGCKLGLTTQVKVADLSECSSLTIPRLDTNDFPPISEKFKCRLDKERT